MSLAEAISIGLDQEEDGTTNVSIAFLDDGGCEVVGEFQTDPDTALEIAQDIIDTAKEAKELNQ